jgi:hypothetical protein
MGGTATEAAILQEAAQKRINLVNTMTDMDSMIRIGRLKWSNIQFFYPIPRIEKITKDNEEREKKVYRKVKVDGKEYTVNKAEGGYELDMHEIEGASGITLDKKTSRFMEGDYDLTMNAGASSVLSKPLMQAKITEMFGLIALNPALQATIDPDKAVRRYLEINDEEPKLWMRGKGLTEDQWKRMASSENKVMATGIPLLPTEGATQTHTEEHLNYMNTREFEALPEAIQDLIAEHAFGEAEAQGAINPDEQSGGMPPQPQVADLEPGTPAGANAQDQQVDMMRG